VKHSSPPRLATWLLEKLGSSYCSDSLAGDLLEQWRAGRASARYWRLVLMAVLLRAGQMVRVHGITFALAVSSFWTVIKLSRLVNPEILLWGYRARRSVFEAMGSTPFALDVSIVTENAIGLTWFATVFFIQGCVIGLVHRHHAKTAALTAFLAFILWPNAPFIIASITGEHVMPRWPVGTIEFSMPAFFAFNLIGSLLGAAVARSFRSRSATRNHL
jgi:hypothetical protein